MQKITRRLERLALTAAILLCGIGAAAIAGGLLSWAGAPVLGTAVGLTMTISTIRQAI
jgi:hypothetical protein